MKEKSNKSGNSLTLDDLFSKIESGVKEINIVLKAKKVNNSYKADNDNSKTDSNQMSIISNLNHNAYSSATTKRNKPQTAKSKKK